MNKRELEEEIKQQEFDNGFRAGMYEQSLKEKEKQLKDEVGENA